jgi:hypothetical protein
MYIYDRAVTRQNIAFSRGRSCSYT